MPNISYKSKNECCGCGACENICPKKCIDIVCDKEGFEYPKVNEQDCIDCGLCVRTCPWEGKTQASPIKIYGLKAKDKELQYKSSSGGAFLTIANHLLNEGYVVFGATYTDDYSKVEHVKIETCSDLNRLRGSKYVQSNLSDIFTQIKNLLNSGRKVAFSGTGCQVAALKLFLRNKEYDGLVTIDILCHGVPSPLLFKEFIKRVSGRYGKILSMNMKDKTDGWGAQKIKVEAERPVPQSVLNLWSSIFYSRVALRPSCYECKFMSLERSGDISLGDFWGVEKVDKEFTDKAGVSLALFGTTKGLKIYETLSSHFEGIEVSGEECLQPVLVGPEKAPGWRMQFWDTYYKFGFDEIAYRYWGIAFVNKLRLKINRIIRRFY